MRVWLLALVYWAAASLAVNSFMERFGLNENAPRNGVSAILDGTAYRPFAYRVLVPMVLQAIGPDRLVAFHARVGEFFHGRVDAKDAIVDIRERLHTAAEYKDWNPVFAAKYWTVYLICMISLVLAMFTMRQTFLARHPGATTLAEAGPVAFCVVMPIIFQHGGYFYDFTEILLLAAVHHVVATGRAHWAVLLLPVATLNKETGLFYAFIVLPWIAAGGSRRRQLAWLGLGLALAVVCSLWVRSRYADNPGWALVWQWSQNVEFWTRLHPFSLFTTVLAAGMPFPKVQNPLFLLPIIGLLALRWRALPVAARASLIVALAINVPLMLLFCYLDEVRNMSLTFLPLYVALMEAWSDGDAPAASV